MTWVRLDDGFAEHPKMEAVGPLGMALQVAALCYCARHLTDGHLPASKVPRLLDLPQWRKVVATLEREGVWDATEDGWVIHDYLAFQPSRDSVEAERSGKAGAGKRGNHKRWHVDRNDPRPDCPYCVADGIAEPIAPAIAEGIPPSRPVPSLVGNSLQQLSRVPPSTAAAALNEAVEIVADRRALKVAASAKRSPSAWLASAKAGIRDEIHHHPAFNATFSAGAEALADLIEPRTERRAPTPRNTDPSQPIGA